MRAYTPGGRFDAEFETNDILSGINADLQRPVGTSAKWWVFDPVNTAYDDVYDVGAITGGRRWRGPFDLPIIRSVISQGRVDQNQRGYYNMDTLHLTVNAYDLEAIVPGVLNNPDLQNRGRVVWKRQVYRPVAVQERGIIAERYTLITIDLVEVMSEEMVNDPQFQAYATDIYDDPYIGYGGGDFGENIYGG
jgi:hypothetical protein